MGHRANKDFFKAKREWSKRKDLVLAYYLKPYLAKIATQRRPVCIVDGFAGPGLYDSGEEGSPLIIAKAIVSAKGNPRALDIRLLAIEDDDELFPRLKASMGPYPFAEPVHGTFLASVPRVRELARTHSTLLYLDPYTVRGLSWASIDEILGMLSFGSVELLLNFNVASLARRGLAALKLAVPPVNTDIEEPDDTDTAEILTLESPTILELNAIVGGDWWQRILKETVGFEAQVVDLTREFATRLRRRFAEVFTHPIVEKWSHRIPKYVLVFGSRHPDTLELMNDAMALSRERLAGPQPLGVLFETRPESLVPNIEALDPSITQTAPSWIQRGKLIEQLMRKHFSLYKRAKIRSRIEQLLKAGRIISENGKTRINDDVRVKNAK